jgi:surface protein
MRSMFDGCLALSTIYVSKWDTNKVTDNGAEMFGRCSKLVGGAGTEWNYDFTDLDYARIDCGTDSPGYFTDKNATGIKSVTKNETEASSTLYDLQGRRLTAKPAKGIYIQNGQKIISK